ncbi:MFS general substrate transporter [Gloeopeniophorella convolvens]|nr:MFS general substrate transporter [Gloeopeniophorella convolvens]
MSTSTSENIHDGCVGEQTPLLRKDVKLSKPTPLPKMQLFGLMLLLLAEPIMSLSVLPYISQLVSELPITHGDQKRVGYYAGIIISLYFVGESFTVLQWSRLSDRIGRRPVLLGGIVGLMLATTLFGLSRTFWALSISRFLAGALNGNIGVTKSMVAELTDESNMAQGFSLLPMAWALGATVGPSVGGIFARPHDRWPNAFSNQFWLDYPYFLPCAVTTAYAMVPLAIASIFLKETLHRDSQTPESGEEVSEIIIDVRSNNCSARPPPLRSLLTRPVLLTVSNYAAIAFLEISVHTLVPVVYATPVEHGGLGLGPARTGICMGAYGIMNGLLQVTFFARIVKRLGVRGSLVAFVSCLIPTFLLFPIAGLHARRVGMDHALFFYIFLQLFSMVGVDMTYGCIFMYVSSAAPNKGTLGATNGLAQTVASVQRSVGPAISASLFAFSLENNIMGGYGVFYALTALTFSAIWLATRLPRDSWKLQDEGRFGDRAS